VLIFKPQVDDLMRKVFLEFSKTFCNLRGSLDLPELNSSFLLIGKIETSQDQFGDKVGGKVFVFHIQCQRLRLLCNSSSFSKTHYSNIIIGSAGSAWNGQIKSETGLMTCIR
jgi:hypothetical protein